MPRPKAVRLGVSEVMGGDRVLAGKNHKGTFCGKENDLYLDWGGIYMDAFAKVH